MSSFPSSLIYRLIQRSSLLTGSSNLAADYLRSYCRQVHYGHIGRIVLTSTFILLSVIFLIVGTLMLKTLVNWLSIPGVKHRDFTTIYLLASAIRYRIDITLPLTTIGEYLGIDPTLVGFYHPTPHPPTMGLLLLPFGYMDYTLGSLIWLTMEFLFLVIAIALLALLVRFRLHPLLVIFIALALVGWGPVFWELRWGQVSILLLLLHIGMLLLLQRGYAGGAGVLFGLAVLIKPLTVPVAALLLLRHQWRVLGATLGTVVAGYAVALLAVGPSALVKYFTQSLPTVSRFYSAFWHNLSLATLGSRLFESMWLPAIHLRPEDKVIASEPLIASPPAAQAIMILLPLLIIGTGVGAVRRLPFDSAIPILLCISIVASPISWGHYEVLALPLIAQTLAWLKAHRWPRKPTIAVVCILILLLVWEIGWLYLGISFAQLRLEGRLSYYPAFATLPMLMPSLLLLWLVVLHMWTAHHPRLLTSDAVTRSTP